MQRALGPDIWDFKPCWIVIEKLGAEANRCENFLGLGVGFRLRSLGCCIVRGFNISGAFKSRARKCMILTWSGPELSDPKLSGGPKLWALSFLREAIQESKLLAPGHLGSETSWAPNVQDPTGVMFRKLRIRKFLGPKAFGSRTSRAGKFRILNFPGPPKLES
jgi:hypothetical protein